MTLNNTGVFSLVALQIRLSVVGEVPFGDDIESVEQACLVRVGRLRHIIPVRGGDVAVGVRGEIGQWMMERIAGLDLRRTNW